jgi:hypothetical protein
MLCWFFILATPSNYFKISIILQFELHLNIGNFFLNFLINLLNFNDGITCLFAVYYCVIWIQIKSHFARAFTRIDRGPKFHIGKPISLRKND